MRDIFDDIFSGQPRDPVEAARRSLRPAQRKRFYSAASAGEPDGGHYPVLLDGKPVRTPARRMLGAPSRKLAQAIAAEWQAQAEVVDPMVMPLTRLANSILDGVADARAAVMAEILKYAGTDLLCYRAAEPDRLVARQNALWDPILGWARDTLGARFVLAQGIAHVAQSDATIAAAGSAIPREVWPLGAVHAITTLTGSALIALALAQKAIALDDAWAAANVDDDWNTEQWGRDEAAMERRAFRFTEMQAAARVLAPG